MMTKFWNQEFAELLAQEIFKNIGYMYNGISESGKHELTKNWTWVSSLNFIDGVNLSINVQIKLNDDKSISCRPYQDSRTFARPYS